MIFISLFSFITLAISQSIIYDKCIGYSNILTYNGKISGPNRNNLVKSKDILSIQILTFESCQNICSSTIQCESITFDNFSCTCTFYMIPISLNWRESNDLNWKTLFKRGSFNDITFELPNDCAICNDSECWCEEGRNLTREGKCELMIQFPNVIRSRGFFPQPPSLFISKKRLEVSLSWV